MSDFHQKQTITNTGSFSIPSKLYGRSSDVAYLFDSFERIKQGSTEIMMITGPSGVGKSTLVSQFEQYIEKENLFGYVITGKCDKLERNIPYYPIIQAFEEIVQDILETNNDFELLRWKKRLQKSVGGVGKVLTDLIPSLEKIIGKQPDVPTVTGKEAMNRFNQAFQRLLSAVATKHQPLILFIDDLQWIDSASLSLLENITNNKRIKFLMFIGSYRDNEIDTSHPLTKTLEAIETRSLNEGKRVIFQINLHNLSKENTRLLIADSIRIESEEIVDLTNVIYNKTLGNPFFIRQLLQQLFEEGLLSYDTFRYKWSWDLDKIDSINITENVVDLMVKKVIRLPSTTAETLRIASCIGRKFDMKTIETINQRLNTDTYDTSFNATYKHLEKARQEGLVTKENDNYKFSHDKVHQAVSSLNSDLFNKKVHLHIGRLLFAKLKRYDFNLKELNTDDFNSEEIFTIVNHWNKGVVFIESKLERSQLATLNLLAGRKAISATAYKAAMDYLNNGIALLYEDSWERDYELSLALHSDMMEIEFLNGQTDNLKQRFEHLQKNTISPLDMTKAYEIRIQHASSEQQLDKAISLGLEILEKLGMKFPAKANRFTMLISVIQMRIFMFRKNIEKSIELPVMTDPQAKAIMRIFQSIGIPIYLGGSKYISTYIYRGLKHTFKYGNSPEAIFAYGGYGLIVTTALKRYDIGLQVSNLLDKLIVKFDTTKHLSFSTLVQHAFLRHPKIPIGDSLAPLKKAFDKGLKSGEMEFTIYVSYIYTYFSFFRGVPLSEVIAELREVAIYTTANTTANNIATDILMLNEQTYINIHKDIDNPIFIDGEIAREEDIHVNTRKNNKALISINFYVNKMILGYLFNDYKKAVLSAMTNEQFLSAASGGYIKRMYYFYSTLSFYRYLSSNQKVKAISDTKIKKKIKKYTRIIKEYSEHSKENFLHKYKVIQAESFRASGKVTEAGEAYRTAILLSEKEDFINDTAIICELAASFYFSHNELPKAKAHLNKAIRCYTEWEAHNKVAHLKEEYKEYL